MQGDGFFLTIAQVAVTLAGFSGLVVAMRGNAPDTWHPRDIWSLSWMLGTSFGALFLALLPPLLGFLHFSESSTWVISDLTMCLFMAGLSVVLAISGRRLTSRGHPPRVRGFPVAAVMLLLVSAGLSGVSAIFFPQWRTGFFALGLVICLFVSALALVVFLVLLAPCRANPAMS